MNEKKIAKSSKKKILMLNYEFPTQTSLLQCFDFLLKQEQRISPLGGGASPVSYELAKGYVKLGHDVDVVTMGVAR